MVQYKGMKKKLIITAVFIMLCLSTFIFAGFGKGGGANAGGTLNITDANRFVVFTSKSQLDEYAASHKGDFFNLSAEERAKFDEEFFAENALVMFLTDGMSGSIKVSCDGYELKGDELHVTVKERSPMIHTMDLRYNTLTVAVTQNEAKVINKVVLNSYRVEI